jgi:UDP-N-acetylglucosamine:LPS N-acetylglucosamine transferase
LQQLIESSGIVICRSGYSSIMDLAQLGKKAIFIPTPGQSEQVYLADYFMTQKICFSQAQDKFELAFALQQSKHYKGFNAASYPRS